MLMHYYQYSLGLRAFDDDIICMFKFQDWILVFVLFPIRSSSYFLLSIVPLAIYTTASVALTSGKHERMGELSFVR